MNGKCSVSMIIGIAVVILGLVQLGCAHKPDNSYAAVKEEPEGEEKGEKKVVIDGVDRYRVIELMVEGVRIILTHRGEKYSPAYIQGISRVAFQVAGICPCAPTCGPAMGPEDLLKLLGYRYEHLPLSGDGIDPEKEIGKSAAPNRREVRGELRGRVRCAVNDVKRHSAPLELAAQNRAGNNGMGSKRIAARYDRIHPPPVVITCGGRLTGDDAVCECFVPRRDVNRNG